MDNVTQTNFYSKLPNRKVYVVNSYHEPFVQEFRGTEIKVPPNGEKKVIMNLLEAERFLSMFNPYGCPPEEKLPNGDYPKGRMPKALKIIEIEEDKVESIGKTTQAEVKAKIKEEEDKVKYACTICGHPTATEKGLKIHTTTKHPEWETISEK